jgi:hypothetical protein
MAVNLKPDPAKGWATCALFNVDKGLIQKAKDHGIVVVSTTPGVYTIKSKTKVFSNVSIKGTAISLVEKKSLGPTSIEQYKFALEAGLKKAISETPLPEVNKVVEVADMLQPLNAPTAWPMPEQPSQDGLKAASAAANLGSLMPKQKPTFGGVSALKDAVTLYEPVKGTNTGSIYYTFAFFPGLKMAARIMGTKLSVRAEGQMLASYLPTLKSQLFMDEGKVGGQTTYASAHFKDVDKDLIVKALAVAIGVLGFGKAEKVADLQKFVGDQT